MDNNNQLDSTQAGAENTQGKTFTQDDVNRIVQERLVKERNKGTAAGGDDDITRRSAELDKRERRLNAVETLRKEGLPDYLVDALNMNTEEDFQKSLEAVKKMKGESPAAQQIGTGSPIGSVGQSTGGGVDPLKQAFGLK